MNSLGQPAGIKQFAVTLGAWRLAGVGAGLLGPSRVLAQAAEEAPPLLAPLPPIPPTIWEQYGLWITLGVLVIIVLKGVAIWWLLQPKPKLPEPIEVATQRELFELEQQPEDGATVSRISRCVRRYYATAFGLPAGEATTAEFQRWLAAQATIPPELASAVSDFLRRADEYKFAPGASGTSGWTQQARSLFERGEQRRRELRPPGQ